MTKLGKWAGRALVTAIATIGLAVSTVIFALRAWQALKRCKVVR